MRFPNTTEELIRALDENYFPENIPTPGDAPDKVFWEAGQRSVVQFLKQWRDRAGDPPPTPRQRGKGRPVSNGG